MSLAEEANISFPESNVGFAGSPKKNKMKNTAILYNGFGGSYYSCLFL